SGYTERYLGIKSDKSAEAYRRTNVTQLAANFWNKDLFLVHGTADDNVHYQNTAQLVKALVLENIDFEFMTYPDDSHGLTNSQVHVFQRITTFLVDTFNRTSERRRLLRGRTHGVCQAPGGPC
uniref:Peptidase_S9 domain-containing protein n=1 Tax=Macrostomum lignano TaxID=282301 RepID=A0A1I8IDT5_9PLAT